MHMPMTAYGVMTTVGNSCPRVQLPCHAPFSVSAVAEMPTLKHPSLPTLPKNKRKRCFASAEYAWQS
jgi:hypothetical protein